MACAGRTTEGQNDTKKISDKYSFPKTATVAVLGKQVMRKQVHKNQNIIWTL